MFHIFLERVFFPKLNILPLFWYFDIQVMVQMSSLLKNNKRKQTDKQKIFDILKLFLSITRSLSFDIFFNEQLQMFVITIYGTLVKQKNTKMADDKEPLNDNFFYKVQLEVFLICNEEDFKCFDCLQSCWNAADVQKYIF